MKPKAGYLKGKKVKWGLSLHTIWAGRGGGSWGRRREMSKKHPLTLFSIPDFGDLLTSLDQNIFISPIFVLPTL